MALDAGSQDPLYQQLADLLTEQIGAGVFRPGDRLPSVRRLHTQHTVSVTTVLEACRVLEDRGLIRARPKSGYYVQRPAATREPDVPTAASRSRRVDRSLALDINLGIGNPQHPTLGAAVQGPELMPITTINRLLAQVNRLHPTACHSYDAPPGSIELRRAIARRSADAGYTVSPDEIVITGGAKEAVYLSIRTVTKPGDTVAIESPAYYALLEVLASLDLRAVEIPSHPRHGIDLDRLERVLQRQRIAAIALMANFSNPTGSCMPDDAKRRLVELAEHHGTPIVDDDVYGNLAFDGHRPRSLKAFDTSGIVMSCASYSKSLSPGLRVGWAIPGRFLERFELLKLVVNQATAVAPQLAIAAYLESGGFDRHLRRVQRTYAAQMDRMIDAVERHLPGETRHTVPRGGHVLWIQLPAGVDSIELYHDAHRHGIQFAPGPMFSAAGGFRDHLRLNTGFPHTSATDEQVATLGRLVAEHRTRRA
ncbi:MAG: PLP-dependent aminotransferase family protein [Ilumatobacteraceae bacterium]